MTTLSELRERLLDKDGDAPRLSEMCEAIGVPWGSPEARRAHQLMRIEAFLEATVVLCIARCPGCTWEVNSNGIATFEWNDLAGTWNEGGNPGAALFLALIAALQEGAGG